MAAPVFVIASVITTSLGATTDPAIADAASWSVARNPYFEVYSQAGPERAKFTLMRFEELRTLFQQIHILNAASKPITNRPTRVLEFRSAKQYNAVQLRPTADAYYSAADDREYIVMPIVPGNSFSLAAHEYAHHALYSSGLKLPPWLNEGLAELFSTVKVNNGHCEWGGPVANRLETLRHYAWLPAPQLLAAAAGSPETRTEAAVFYAESWALADMLTFSPKYAPHFGALIEMLNSGVTSSRALAQVYGVGQDHGLDQILADTREWVGHGGSSTRKLTSIVQQAFTAEAELVPESQAKALIADLLLTNGECDRAEQIYNELLLQSPDDPNLLVRLGSIALQKRQPQRAIAFWHKALNTGLNNAELCYRYAMLTDQVDPGSEQIAQALEKAVALQPDFNNARFRLAQIRSNAGEYSAAVNQLLAIEDVPAAMAFGYWTSLAYAFTELGQRTEAEAAAEQAKRFATEPAEYARVDDLIFIAKTEMSVRYQRDAAGKQQLVTTRIPHGAAAPNPFFESDDKIQTAFGLLKEVQCSDGKLTGFLLESAAQTLKLTVPDPTHILVRKVPNEFVCGPQNGLKVKVEYAVTPQPQTGILRGMEF